MNKIATHNSATGEKGHGILSFLVTPFARTQSKTLREQFNAGCRSFDIRIRKTKRGWVCAHGLWTSKRTADNILQEISSFGERVEVSVMYEGGENKEFEDFATRVRTKYPDIVWGTFTTKFGNYVAQLADREYSGGKQGFVVLDGRSWHTYIPIPWLWNFVYTRNKEFNEETFTFVDFL